MVGIIGRLSAQKNPGYALHVLEALFRMEPSARAFFAGDGPLLEEIKDKAKRAGTGERIVFTGAVDDVPAWMSAADVLLMPSLFEGFPFVLIEAQTSGLPCVVSSNVTREADLTGLVRFADLSESPDEWAKKLIECAGQKRKDYTAQIVAAGYTVQHMSEQVQKMIEGGDTRRG